MKAIILSVSSDIGSALANRWLDKGYSIFGTYRTWSTALESLRHRGVQFVQADFSNIQDLDQACTKLIQACPQWDVMVVAVGSQVPIGQFTRVNIEEWSDSISINFTNQMRAIHRLLPARSAHDGVLPAVVLFAGGGTNNAPLNYSAYTVSKVASIKMCELLNREVSDCKFTIVGPGWVKTKIHQTTLSEGKEKAEDNYERTNHMLKDGTCTSMKDVLDSLDWVVSQPREVVGGKNISTFYDKWNDPSLVQLLKRSPDMGKLRRSGNEEMAKRLWKDEQGFDQAQRSA